MLLAEFPTVAPDDLGRSMIVLAALLIIAGAARKLWVSFFPPGAPASEQFITRDELQTVVEEIKQEQKQWIDNLKRELDAAIRAMAEKAVERMEATREQFATLKEQYRELRDYASRSSHDTNEAMHTLSLKVERVAVNMETLLAKKPMAHSEG